MTISKKCVLLNSNSSPAVAGGQQKADSERQVRWADYDSMLDEDLQLDTDEANQSCMGVKTSTPCAVYPLTSEGVQGVATREAEWSRSSCPGDAAEGRSPEAEGRPTRGRGVGRSPGYLELGSSPLLSWAAAPVLFRPVWGEEWAAALVSICPVWGTLWTAVLVMMVFTPMRGEAMFPLMRGDAVNPLSRGEFVGKELL